MTPQTKPPEARPQTVPAFRSSTPWEDTSPDSLFVSCSDHRFERQTRDLANHLGFVHPHVIQLPGGAALTLPMATAFGFISRAIDLLLEKIIALKHPKEIILVAHHDCGAYKGEHGNALVGAITKMFAQKQVPDLQREHLAKAAARLRLAIRGIPVRAFYANVVEDGDGKRVEYIEVTS